MYTNFSAGVLEEALRRSEEHYALAVAGSNDGLWDWNILTGDDYLSPRWKKLLGFEEHELANREESFFTRLHPDDVPRVEAALRHHLEERVPYSLELRLRHKSGVYRWFLSRGQAIWDVSGKPVRMAGSITDITERKEAEAALREAEAKYRALVEQIPAVTYIAQLNAVGTALYMSPQIEPLLGFTLAEWQNNREFWSKRLHPEDRERVLALMEHTVREQVPFSAEYRLLARDGQAVWFQDEGRVIQDPCGQSLYLQGVMLDITRRKQEEEELQASRERLRAFALHLDAAIEAERVRLSRELHDEFGQSLTGVKMGLAMLRQQIEDVMPNSMLPALSDRITSMSKLIDSTIKSMRRIAMELRPPLLDRVGLGAAIKTYTQEFQERTGLRCHLRVNSQIRLREAQAIHVYRIFQEAMTNIARHAEAAQVEIKLLRRSNTLVLEIRDDGRGISDAQLRGSDSLGLAGLHERARLLNGSVSTHRNTPRGTIIRLEVPDVRSTSV